MEESGQLHPRPFYASEKEPRCPLNRRLGGPRKGLEDLAENKPFAADENLITCPRSSSP